MDSIIKAISEKFSTFDLEQCAEGLDMASRVIRDLTQQSLKLIESKRLNNFVITERIFLFFDSYLNSLNKLLETGDEEVKFYVSTLFAAHNINNKTAEILLLNAIRNGNISYACIATTILKRQNNPFVADAVKERLEKKIDIEKKYIVFFEESLEDITLR